MGDCFELGEEIAALATQVNVATHGLLVRIRRFDEAEGWGEQGAKSCAHWLTWRIGLDPGTAREKVRVARALGTLPRIDEAFASGKLSYAKVRAVTRIATPHNEEQALETAMAATGAQLERICHRLRRATEGEQEMASERRFRARPLGEGLVKVELVVSSDEADLIVQAVEQARKQLSGPRPTAADGLMEMVSSYLSTGTAAADAPGPSAEVVIHMERDSTAAEPTFAGSLEDGTHVSAEALRRVCCDAGLVPATLDHDRNVLDVGRRTRSIPPAIRRALWIRDKGCRFPGCTSTRFLHGHHVNHWLHGGETSLDNLVFLCSFHHRLVHEGGFSLTTNDAAEVTITAPTGRNVSAETAQDAVVEWRDSSWDDRGPSPMPLPDWDGEPVDYDAAVDAAWPTAALNG
ncbi:MAG TPA: DUF222 domain-containing protein [Polyangia bacterium]|nr:DUF222 domain-containing protein [Polyangia bacterium]